MEGNAVNELDVLSLLLSVTFGYMYRAYVIDVKFQNTNFREKIRHKVLQT